MPEIHVEPDRAAEFLQKLGRDAANAEWQDAKKAEDLQAKVDSADSEPDSWRTLAAKTVDFTANAVCPAWELTSDEKAGMAESVAEVLDHYFPGAVAGFDNWHPLAKLAGTMFFIVALRIDYQTGRIAPLHKKDATNASEPQRRADDSDDGQEPERKNAGDFTIGGG